MPRPISSSTTKLCGVAWVRMAAVSTISIMKVERPRARSSPAPTRLNSRSTTPRRIDRAGTKAPAWATAEALHETNRARTLFATHYHELARLEERLDHVCNLSMKAREWNGDLVFLHEAAPGAADRSYGVQVAKLAGVPSAVVGRAREVLERLESEKAAAARLDDLPLFAAVAEPAPAPMSSALDDAVAAIDPDELTPREALEALYRLKGLAKA